MDGVTDAAIRELGFSAVPPVLPVHVMRTLRRITEASAAPPDVVHAFEESYERTLKEERTERPSEHVWTLYWPLKIKLDSSVPASASVTVLGTRFRLARTSTVVRLLGRRHFEPAALRQLLPTTKTISLPAVFMVASMKAPDADEAWRRLTPAFDIIRGLMEYRLGFGRWQIFFGAPKPRARVPHPEWMLIKAPAQPLDGMEFIYETDDPSTRLEFGNRHLQAVRALAQDFRKSPAEGSTLALIADSLRLYAQAMDDRHAHAVLLSLWQLAERLTLSEEIGGDTSKVSERLAWLVNNFGIPGSGVSNLLSTYARKRNMIVHRGIRIQADDDDINILKRINERALLWLFNERRRIKTQSDLSAVYHLRSKGDAGITAYLNAARFIHVRRKSP
jgi:hypothetical protein